MASANVARALKSGTDDRSLAATFFEKEVLIAFRTGTIFYNMLDLVVAHRMVTEGKSWKWPLLGDAPSSEYHTPGAELLGQAQSASEVTVNIDDELLQHRHVPSIDVSLSHWDIIGTFARDMGTRLSIELDTKVIRMLIKAARTAASSGFHSGGNLVARTGAGDDYSNTNVYPTTTTGSTNYRDDAAQLAQLMDEDNVPREGRYLVIPPYIQRVLTKDTTLFSRDYQLDGDNVLNKRVIGMMEGFRIFVSPNFPAESNITGDSPPSDSTKYDVDNRYDVASNGQVAGIAFCAGPAGQAVAMVEQSPGMETIIEKDNQRRTVFMSAAMLYGLGVWKPWCAGVIQGRDS